MLLINNFFVFALKEAVDDSTCDAVNNSNKTWSMLIICSVQKKYY